ncbi:hypothetical protein AB1Y20_003142 [Prymnesium parvum]|uniref:Glycosyl transferase CAP10 domain-containing protein n=1 Tax=Prymnesium parvum TaxID=97485 RepID=A0AB34J9Z4_PRYPA
MAALLQVWLLPALTAHKTDEAPFWKRRKWRRQSLRRKRGGSPHADPPAPLGNSSDGCALPLWAKERFEMAQDWMVVADAPSLRSPDTWLRWDGTAAAGHLYAAATRGYMNFRPPEFIRGHGDSPHEPRSAAPKGGGTLLRIVPPESAPSLATETLAAEAGEQEVGAACAPLERGLRLQFVESRRFVGVDEAGQLHARKLRCADGEVECTFDRLRVDAPAHFALRSRRSGHFVRFEGAARPSALRVSHLRGAAPKRPRPLAAGGAGGRCPLRRPPEGWAYNASEYAPLVRRSLGPWHEGNITAAMLDFAFDESMFAAASRREGKPASQHVSIVGGVVRMKSNNDYRKDMLVDMLKTASSLVHLPDVEFLINLWDHPKVPQQNAEPILAMYVDDAHNDIAAPSAHAWDDRRHDYPSPHTQSGAAHCPPFERRTRKLFFRGGSCTGPTDSYRAWNWRFYNRKRISVLSRRYPDLIDAGLVDYCGSLKVNKLEWPWDQQMVEEMRVEAPPSRRVPWSSTCTFRYLLNLDGNAAASRLASLLHTGSAVFFADSPFKEWWYPLLKPWVHYVPVDRSLRDLVERVEWANAHPDAVAAIGAAGAAFARQHLHKHAIACYWWQLLSEFAALQSFQPRVHGFPEARYTGRTPR